MKHVIHHNVGLLRSKQLTEKAFADYARRYSKYSPSLTWHDDRRASFGFTAKGLTLHGTMELRPSEIEVEMDVPFLLRVFKPQAMRVLDREVNRILADAAPREEQAPPT